MIDFFYAIKISNTLNAASKKVFDMEFDKLQVEWKNYLKRKYFPFISSFDVPYEAFERKTDHKKDGSYMNIAPRFSPDGENYLYFSNKNLRTDIWKGSTLDLSTPKRILKSTDNIFPVRPGMDVNIIAPRDVPVAIFIGRPIKNRSAGTNRKPPPIPSIPAINPATAPIGIIL